MAPREIERIAFTSYPSWCLPDNYGRTNVIVAVEEGAVEFDRRRLELSGVQTHIAQLFATYLVQRTWQSVDRVVRGAIFDYARIVDSTDVAKIAEKLGRLVDLAKSHEWFTEELVGGGDGDGLSWRVHRDFGKKTFGKKGHRPFPPDKQYHLLSAHYRKCYDVCEDAYRHCCANRCSRKLVFKRDDEVLLDDVAVTMNEKCKFCFAREHSTECQASIACRCACLVYHHDMMRTPFGEGTFEFSDSHNRMASFVDTSNGRLIVPCEVANELVGMGFATVGSHSSWFLSAASVLTNMRSETAERILTDVDSSDNDDDEEDAAEAADDEDEPVPKKIRTPPLPMTDDNDKKGTIAVLAPKISVPAAITVVGDYSNVMIRCCACLFTVALSTIVSWDRLNFMHGAHCPRCAFVRHPFTSNSTVLSFIELSYTRQFVKLRALSYSPCSACECRHIASSSS